jgi:hypothetical protein
MATGIVIHGDDNGGGSGIGWDGQVEFRSDLPITIGIPPVGSIYLVEKKTTLFGFTTYQSGLYIKELDTGSLNDWRRLNIKVTFQDNEFTIVKAADNSSKAQFDLSLLSTSTTRVLTVQDKDGTIALLSDISGSNSLDADAFPTFDTAVALSDLNLIIADLEALPVTGTHADAFVTETLVPGVYTTTGAATINGTLTLDGSSVSAADRIFVIRSAAAITTGASANIVLTGGTLPENVHFLAVGAFALGAGTVMNGNMISKVGAPSAGAGCTVVGRMLTTNGAVSASGINLTLPLGVAINIDYRTCIDLVQFTGVTTIANTGTSFYTGNIASASGGAITGFGSPTTLNGTIYPMGLSTENQNNYLPFETAGSVTFADANIVYIFPISDMEITGFDSTGILDNHEFTLINLGVGEATLKSLSPNSTNDNKIAADTDIILKQYQSKDVVRRNVTLNKWLIKGNN